MDFKIQLKGLNELLSVIYGGEMQLDALLGDLGFEQSQIEQLQGQHLESIAAGFLEILHKRLTNDAGKDTYYLILRRRYGLDGESPQPLSAIAEKLNFSPEYLRQVFEEIIQRCRSKTWQSDLGKSLKYIVVDQLEKMNQRPGREHIAEKLQRLSNLRGAADVARLDYEAKRADILRQIQAELDALDSEYKPILNRRGKIFPRWKTRSKQTYCYTVKVFQAGCIAPPTPGGAFHGTTTAWQSMQLRIPTYFNSANRDNRSSLYAW
jgi:hypothetical protein